MRIRKISPVRRLLFGLAEMLGPPLIRLMHMTLRTRARPVETMLEMRAGRVEPCLIAMWHQTQLIPAWVGRHQGNRILISQHADGEYIARIVKRLGLHPIRGSSTRGGRRALRTIVHELQAGHRVAMTPDGPKGPRFRIQPGIILAASLSGRPIRTVGVGIDRVWRFRSWDRFVVPKPFANVLLLFGPVIRVPPHLDTGAREAYRLEVERTMRDLTARAYRQVRRGHRSRRR